MKNRLCHKIYQDILPVFSAPLTIHYTDTALHTASDTGTIYALQ